jgi:hypothetical protein
MKRKRFFEIIKNPVVTFVDWYVKSYHSRDYVHRDMIRPEISKHIKLAEERVNKIRDNQEEIKMEALRLQFQIMEDGYLAEIESMEATVEDVLSMRDELVKLYYEVEKRIEEVSMITAQNRHHGMNIIEKVSEQIGNLEKIGYRSEKLDKRVKGQKPKDMETLRIK